MYTYCRSLGWLCVSSWGWWIWPSPRGSTVSSASVVIAPLLGDEVHDGEDHDPHHVDKVPVEADDLERLRLRLWQPAAERHHEHRHQHHDADRHVHAVEAGQRVE